MDCWLPVFEITIGCSRKRPSFEGALNVQGASEARRVITFQVWDWSKKSDTCLIRLFIMTRHRMGGKLRELRTRYRAIPRKEVHSGPGVRRIFENRLAYT